MKNLICITISCCLFFSLYAQQQPSQYYPLKTLRDSISFQVIGTTNGLQLESQNALKPGIIDISIPQLEDADIVITCTPDLPEDGLTCALELQLYYPAQAIFLSKEKRYMIPDTDDESFEIRFEDLTERGLYLGETYQLYVHRELLGVINCAEERPVFALEKQLLPASTLAVGLGALAVGELVYGKQQRDRYEDYQNRWKDDLEDDANLLTQAEQARKSRRRLTLGGGIAALAGAGWWYVRWRKVVNKQDQYDTYCGPAESALDIETTFINTNEGLTPGIQLTYKF